MSGRLMVGTRKGLFIVDTATWRLQKPHFAGVSVNIVAYDDRDGTFYACLDHGHFGVKFHRSTDGDQGQEIETPTYPEQPADPADDVEWKLNKVWALVPGHADRPGELWCGTIPGGLFLSRDHGRRWELVRTLWDRPERATWFGGGEDHPGIHSICIDPRDPDHVTVGVSVGGIWDTRDGGLSWECIGEGLRANYVPPEMASDQVAQDPHCMVQCQEEPDLLWIQHHNGVFTSTDGGRRWREVEAQPSSFGFAVAVHPAKGRTAWTVPAVSDECRIPVDGKVVVSRTRDGGDRWEVLRDGLPQEDAYDLVFRHALDIDSSGDSLAFGSTTGKLWVTENGGDRWQAIAAHLPPVYCVRFAA